MILETERLILRPLNLNDLEGLYPILADKEVMRFSLTGPILDKNKTKEYLQKRIDHYCSHGFSLYAVMHKNDQCMIGLVGLTKFLIDDEEEVELGFRLSPTYWRKGLAKEAALAVCHHAFDQLQIDELISLIDPQNIPSIELAKRLGMHFWKNTIFHGIFVSVYVLKK